MKTSPKEPLPSFAQFMRLDYGVVREHTNSVLLYVEFFGIRVVRVLVCMKEKRRREVWIKLLLDVE